jgi:hypothetical protein
MNARCGTPAGVVPTYTGMSDSGVPVVAPVVETVQRVDAAPSRLGKFSRTGAGAVRVPATISRTGVQMYGKRAEYRPDSEVFHPDSLASLASVPVTVGHPDVQVNPENVKQFSVGHVSDAPPEARVRLDGDANEWLRATLVIADADTQARIERGDILEVSSGYTCDLDHTPGIAPCGTRYDAVQRNIRFNHQALLVRSDRARAGAQAKLRLDSKGNPMTIKIDGVELEQNSDAHINAIQAAANRQVAEMQAKLDAALAERDAARNDAVSAKADAAPEKIEARVAARLALRADAGKLLPADYKFEGKSDAQVRADAVVAKGVAIEGKSPEYVAAYFDVLLAQSAAPVAAQYVAPKNDSVVHTDADTAFAKRLSAGYEASFQKGAV